VDTGHDDNGASTHQTETTAVSRNNLLRRGAAGAGALVLGGALGAAPAAAREARSSLRLGRRTYHLNYGGATCEAFTYAAYTKHLWTAAGVDVKIAKGQLGVTPVAAMASGKVDFGASQFYSFLLPILQGADIYLTAGLHGGCLRLVVGTNTGIKTYADLKGKTIGANGANNTPPPFFLVDLAKNGLDPLKDVQWRTYPLPQDLGPALDKGEIQAVAGIDPVAYLLEQQGKAVQIGSNMTGMFANMYCCAVAIRGSLVREDPQAAAALTRGMMNGSRYTATHIHEVAGIEAANKYVTVSQATAEHLLSSYTWRPSATLIKGQIEQAARDLMHIGFLPKATDPVALTKKAYIDVFALAAQTS
jgi:NitT/TauT family transport system substrate-binding protein